MHGRVVNGIITSLPFALGTLRRVLAGERSYRSHTVARMQSNHIRSSECAVTRRDSYSAKVFAESKRSFGRKKKEERSFRGMHPVALWNDVTDAISWPATAAWRQFQQSRRREIPKFARRPRTDRFSTVKCDPNSESRNRRFPRWK